MNNASRIQWLYQVLALNNQFDSNSITSSNQPSSNNDFSTQLNSIIIDSYNNREKTTK